MKKFLEKYYYIPENETMTESKVFGRIGISIATIIICLIALSVSAFAFFSHGVSSAKTNITSATYSLSVTSPDLTENNGAFSIENNSGAEKNYQFTISATDNTTASVGYCKIAVTTDYLDSASREISEQLFYTVPIWKQGTEGKASSVQISITVPAGKSITARFISEWGSCAKTPVENGVINNLLFAPEQSGEPQDETKDTPQEKPQEEPQANSSQSETPSVEDEAEEDATKPPEQDEPVDENTEETTENTQE